MTLLEEEKAILARAAPTLLAIWWNLRASQTLSPGTGLWLVISRE